jgi:hypothetical protein
MIERMLSRLVELQFPLTSRIVTPLATHFTPLLALSLLQLVLIGKVAVDLQFKTKFYVSLCEVREIKILVNAFIRMLGNPQFQGLLRRQFVLSAVLILIAGLLIRRSANVIAQPGVLSHITGHVHFGRLALNEVVVTRQQSGPADEEAIVRSMSDDSIEVDLKDSSVSADVEFLLVRTDAYEETRINVKHSLAAETM